MAEYVKKLLLRSDYSLIDIATGNFIDTVVMYTEQDIASDITNIPAFLSQIESTYMNSVNKSSTHLITDPGFSYNNAITYNGSYYWPRSSLAGGAYPKRYSTETLCAYAVGRVVGASRALPAIIGKTDSQGISNAPIGIAPYISGSGSSYDYDTYLTYIIGKVNGAYQLHLIEKTGPDTNQYVASGAISDPETINEILSKLYDNPTDPYTGAGYPESTAPGGSSGGSFDFTEDGLSGVHTPALDILNCGLVTAWRPSKATLAQLSQWLWTTTPGQIIQQLFGNPINAIIGLHIVPVSPDVDSGSGTIKFGAEDSGVACHKITSQHVTVDCGSLKITHKYGSYLDYAPQASAEIFLPYVGGLPLDVNDVIDKTLSVRYKVDVLSGACVAYVFVDGVLHYQKSGCCAATAPITGSQMPNVVSGVLSIVGSVAGAVASMGASGAGTAAKVASGIATGTSVAESAANMMKQSISYSGTVSGWAGLLGAQKPYVILTLPNAAIPGGQNALMGYPAWVSGKVGDFRGYTECAIDRVYSYRATDQEVEEIKSLMAGGVVL